MPICVPLFWPQDKAHLFLTYREAGVEAIGGAGAQGVQGQKMMGLEHWGQDGYAGGCGHNMKGHLSGDNLLHCMLKKLGHLKDFKQLVDFGKVLSECFQGSMSEGSRWYCPKLFPSTPVLFTKDLVLFTKDPTSLRTFTQFLQEYTQGTLRKREFLVWSTQEFKISAVQP